MTTDTNEVSNTPRTDAIEFRHCPPQPEAMLKKHEDAYALSRELERELLTARNDAFNLANALSKSEAEVERLKDELTAWDYGTRAKREQERAEKAEAEVERLKASVQHYKDQALHFQHAWEKVQAMYNKLIYTSTKPIEPQQDDK